MPFIEDYTKYVFMIFKMWQQNYRLDQMTLGDLWVAFFMHYTVQAYLILAAVSAYLTVTSMTSIMPVIAAIGAAIIIYPLAWYLLHRYVLHGKFLYRSPLTAKVWKRIHFDHHRDPHDLNVLFGALYTTLPTILLVTAPFGWIIGGLAGAYAAFCAGLIITCFYEFNHCIQHLNYTPKWKFIQKMKRIHLLHHFHDENANYGITNFMPDKLFGTYAEKTKGAKRSDTVFNLGYTRAEVKQYPWVAELTPDVNVEDAIVNGLDRRKPLREDKQTKAPKKAA